MAEEAGARAVIRRGQKKWGCKI